MCNIHGFGRAALGRYMFLTLALLSSPWAHVACPADTGLSFLVPADFGQIALPGVPVAPPGGTRTVALPPLRGDLSEDVSGTFYYSPSKKFWSLRQDRFVLELAEPGSTKPTAVTVRIFSPFITLVDLAQDFETPSNLGSWRLGGNAAIATSARLDGAFGLHASGDPFFLTDSTVYNVALGLTQISGEGGGEVGAGLRGHFLDDPAPGFGEPPGDFESTVAGLQGQLGPSQLEVWARLRKVAGELAIRLETADSDPNRGWFPVSAQPHRLELLAWPPVTSGGQGRAMLWIDGRFVDELSSPQLLAPDVMVLFGSRDTTGAGSAILWWDEVAALETVPVPSPPQVSCADGFDGAAIDPSWTVHNTVTLGPVETALVGKRSAEFTPDQPGSPVGSLLITNGLAPENIRRLGLRFIFNPASLNMPLGSTIAIADSANTLATRPFRVFIDRVASGNLRMRVAARHDNITAPAVVASFPLTATTHTFELDWWRSETDVLGTGYLRVWLDGEEKANLTGLLNSGQITHEVRFGATAVVGTPSGKLVMDEFDFWYEN